MSALNAIGVLGKGAKLVRPIVLSVTVVIAYMLTISHASSSPFSHLPDSIVKENIIPSKPTPNAAKLKEEVEGVVENTEAVGNLKTNLLQMLDLIEEYQRSSTEEAIMLLCRQSREVYRLHEDVQRRTYYDRSRAQNGFRFDLQGLVTQVHLLALQKMDDIRLLGDEQKDVSWLAYRSLLGRFNCLDQSLLWLEGKMVTMKNRDD